jgi:hypothetical protein
VLVSPQGDSTTINQVHDWERASGIFWIVWGGIQCLSGWLIIAGIWNIFAGISRLRLLPRILARDSTVPNEYESMTQLIVIGIINLFFGGVIGVAFIIFDFKIRDTVLKNRHLFNQAPVAAGQNVRN